MRTRRPASRCVNRRRTLSRLLPSAHVSCVYARAEEQSRPETNERCKNALFPVGERHPPITPARNRTRDTSSTHTHTHRLYAIIRCSSSKRFFNKLFIVGLFSFATHIGTRFSTHAYFYSSRAMTFSTGCCVRLQRVSSSSLIAIAWKRTFFPPRQNSARTSHCEMRYFVAMLWLTPIKWRLYWAMHSNAFEWDAIHIFPHSHSKIEIYIKRAGGKQRVHKLQSAHCNSLWKSMQTERNSGMPHK